MATVFIAYEGDSITANGKKLFQVSSVLAVPFHVTIKPYAENARRIDINENSAIPVKNNSVLLKVGEPLMLDPDFSVMVTRIFNNDVSFCRISVRCNSHVNLRKNDEKITTHKARR